MTAYQHNATTLDSTHYLDDISSYFNTHAIGIADGPAINIINKRYSGRDPIGAPRNAVVTHLSAHDSFRNANEPRRMLKHPKRQIISRIIGMPY